MLSLLRGFDYCNISVCNPTETYKSPRMDHTIKMFINSIRKPSAQFGKRG